MKQFSKTFTALSLAFALVMSMTTVVSAADIDEKETMSVTDKASVYSNKFYSGINISSNQWTTIATSTSGFNCNVYVKCMNTTLDGLRVVGTNIRMLGRNGNVIWSENEAVAGQGSRVFWCGSDIYTIQASPRAGLGVIYCRQD